jgi:hypothetical protein
MEHATETIVAALRQRIDSWITRRGALGLALLAACSLTSAQEVRTARTGYVPPPGDWEARAPNELGLDAARLAEAVAFAREHEGAIALDLAEFIEATFGHEPHSDIVGPTRTRARQNGMILRSGYIAAEWGDTLRPDMTFSVTKTYLSTLVGLAVARGYIGDVHDTVGSLVFSEHFEGDRHGAITWDHLLRQTSDWRGTLWEKPDWADRPPRGALTEEEQRAVPLSAPGTRWEYNDVRVNLLALAALEAWREPLPRVLAREVLDPIGASRTWRWHGYSTSWTTLDGVSVQSVSGGGHHGGGMFVSTRDQARFGLLFLRGGKWGEHEVVPQAWIEHASTPTEANPEYGVMNWYLNHAPRQPDGTLGRRPLPSAPSSAVTFRGAGSNTVFIDWEHDLVLVVRWLDGAQLDSLIGKVLASIVGP